MSASGCRATTQHPDRDGHRFGFRQSRRLCHRLAPARLGHGRERRSRQFGRPLLAQSPRNGRLPALHHDGRLHALQTGRGSARIGQGARQDRHHAGCRGRRRGDRSPETARNGRRREDHLLGRGRPAGFDEHARRDHPQGSAALARRRRQRPAQRTEQLQDIAQRAQFGNDEQQFQGCDPEHARLADQPHRGHHQPLDQVRSRRRGRHHQPHHPTQEAVPRIQRQRRRERHGVGEPGLQRQRQPLDPGREVRGEHHGLCRLLRRGPYPLGIGVVAGKLRLGEPLQPQLLRKQGQFALRQRRTGHELPARHAQPDHAQRMAVARPQPLQIARYERDPRPRNEPAAGIRQPQHPEMELHGRQRLAQLRTHLRQGGAYADHIG